MQLAGTPDMHRGQLVLTLTMPSGDCFHIAEASGISWMPLPRRATSCLTVTHRTHPERGRHSRLTRPTALGIELAATKARSGDEHIHEGGGRMVPGNQCFCRGRRPRYVPEVRPTALRDSLLPQRLPLWHWLRHVLGGDNSEDNG